MRLSISEAAEKAGVSVRTLHYYDEIGLLRPAQVAENGYRFYGEAELETLQQIVFYRELGFSLKDIADILSRPDYDKEPALRRRRELLILERSRIDGLIALVEDAIGGKKMKQEKITAADIEAAKSKYSKETAQRWGKTDAYAESQRRHAGYTTEKEAEIAREADGIFAAFAGLMDRAPSDPEVQATVKLWQEHISKYHYPCPNEMLACMGQMYTADPRFTENLDRFGDGNAKFISEAIAAYCG